MEIQEFIENRLEDLANQAICKMEELYDVSAGTFLMHHPEVLVKMYKPSRNGGIFWITINPDTSKIDLKEFVQMVHGLKTRTFFKSYNMEYCFEQRGTTTEDIGKGFHCHILCNKAVGLSPSQLQKQLYNTFKNYCGNLKHIDVKTYDSSFREEKIDYMKGEKWDEGKLDAVKLNSEWRTQNELLSLYKV